MIQSETYIRAAERLDRDGLELAGVQMAPFAFAPAVDVGAGSLIGGVSPDLPLFEHHLHGHALLCHRQIHAFNRPRCFNSKQMFVQRRVFHLETRRSWCKTHILSLWQVEDEAGVREKSQSNRRRTNALLRRIACLP